MSKYYMIEKYTILLFLLQSFYNVKLLKEYTITCMINNSCIYDFCLNLVTSDNKYELKFTHTQATKI